MILIAYLYIKKNKYEFILTLIKLIYNKYTNNAHLIIKINIYIERKSILILFAM